VEWFQRCHGLHHSQTGWQCVEQTQSYLGTEIFTISADGSLLGITSLKLMNAILQRHQTLIPTWSTQVTATLN
jgi:hypothetical protein